MPGSSQDEDSPQDHSHLLGEAGCDGDQVHDCAAVIPLQRRNSRPAGDNKAWCFEQSFRGGHRRFAGEVTYVGGAEGWRLRREIAVVLAGLLRWAHQQTAVNGNPDTENYQAA